jgi:hypothetical protein
MSGSQMKSSMYISSLADYLTVLCPTALDKFEVIIHKVSFGFE